MNCLGEWVNKTIQKLYFVTHTKVLDPLNGVKMVIIMANPVDKNTKSSILRSVIQLKCCNVINGLSG